MTVYESTSCSHLIKIIKRRKHSLVCSLKENTNTPPDLSAAHDRNVSRSVHILHVACHGQHHARITVTLGAIITGPAHADGVT